MYPLIIGSLSLLLLAAAWYDTSYYRIPNFLVFSGTVIGVLFNTLLPQEMGGIGVLPSLAGLGVGLVILLPLYALRAMGAGDIKLMAMIGAFVGSSSILNITVYVLLVGGILALSVALLRGRFSKLIDNLKFMLFMRLAGTSTMSPITTDNLHQSAGKLPYGVAIAAGTLFYLVTEYRLFA
ncbi:A24 family peptidase [Nitrosomonas nitrosa]|uniref:A24 family peptidase n=1 Tax=Nitrosomonas nitrosa TaxID=52442 RepID=UPI00195E44D2|nr:prepilin peptidase [Nitrosomonas nitrosa]